MFNWFEINILFIFGEWDLTYWPSNRLGDQWLRHRLRAPLRWTWCIVAGRNQRPIDGSFYQCRLACRHRGKLGHLVLRNGVGRHLVLAYRNRVGSLRHLWNGSNNRTSRAHLSNPTSRQFLIFVQRCDQSVRTDRQCTTKMAPIYFDFIF